MERKIEKFLRLAADLDRFEKQREGRKSTIAEDESLSFEELDLVAAARKEVPELDEETLKKL